MKKVIYAEDLFTALRDDINISGANLARIRRHIEVVTAVDVMPVVRGRWEEIEDFDGERHWKCTACGNEWYFEVGTPEENECNYCPKCGADMRDNDE